MSRLRYYGGVPVPFVATWSKEDGGFHVAACPHARAPAICQAVAQGDGKPVFGKPHAQRQRQAIAEGLCDTCGVTLKGRTKVSLSHARTQWHGAEGPAVLQVEPLLHKACAALSLKHCPSLKRDLADGSLKVRQVTRYRVQMAVMSPEYVETVAGVRRKAIGHAKVELLSWRDRDAAWLSSQDAEGVAHD